MGGAKMWRPARAPCIAGPVPMGQRASGNTRKRWSWSRRTPMIRRIAAIGATTELIRTTIHLSTFDDGKQEEKMANVLSNKERALMDAYWRTANYLSV